MRTSSHHQPEAQHPKSPAIETPAGRLPHLLDKSGHIAQRAFMITRALPHNGGIIRTPNIFYKICACAAQ